MKINVVFISSLFVLLSITFCEIKLVIQLSNEGIRTYKNIGIGYLDNDNENELTEKGIIQLITIGKHIRRHYIDKLNYISRKFSRDEIKLYSIGNRVNLESMNYMMNGFFPNEKVFPIKHVNIFPDKCIKIERLEKSNKRKYYSIIDDFSKKYVTQFRTLHDDYLSSYDNVINLCDSTMTAKAENTSFINVNLINDCKQILNNTYFNVYNDESINPMKVALLLHKLIENIESNIDCFSDCAKYINYSISTKDISSIIYFLNTHFKTLHYFPIFNTIIILEIEEVNFSTLIKIHLNDKHLLTINYSEFKNIIIDNIKIPAEVESICHTDDTLIFQIILLVLILFIAIVLGIYIYRMILQLLPKDESNLILEHRSNSRSFTYEFSKNYLYKN